MTAATATIARPCSHCGAMLQQLNGRWYSPAAPVFFCDNDRAQRHEPASAKTREEQALEAIWEHFQNGGDWGNALRVITDFGKDQRRDTVISVKPADLPEGSMVQVTAEGGVFVADYFPEQYSRLTTGSGTAATVGEAIREALDEAGD